MPKRKRDTSTIARLLVIGLFTALAIAGTMLIDLVL